MVDLDKTNTIRGVLSTISSVFDPLNFGAPVMLPAKQIMQTLWRRKVGLGPIDKWRNSDEIGEMEELSTPVGQGKCPAMLLQSSESRRC